MCNHDIAVFLFMTRIDVCDFVVSLGALLAKFISRICRIRRTSYQKASNAAPFRERLLVQYSLGSKIMLFT